MLKVVRHTYHEWYDQATHQGHGPTRIVWHLVDPDRTTESPGWKDLSVGNLTLCNRSAASDVHNPPGWDEVEPKCDTCFALTVDPADVHREILEIQERLSG